MRGLTAPPAWTALAAGLLACAGILLFAAPDRIDLTRISVSGGGGDAVMALEGAVARHNTDPALTASARDDGVVIAERRSGSLLATRDFAGQVLADQVVEDVRQAAAAPVAAIAAPAAAAGLSALLVAQREGVQAEIGSADLSQDQISASLSEIMRDIADLQRAAATPPADNGDDPTKALVAQLQMRRIDLAAKYTADFPGIAATDGEIEQLKALAAQQPKRQAPAIGPALVTLRTEQHRLEDAQAATGARRAALVARRDALDATLAADLSTPPPTAAIAPPPAPSYQIADAGSTALPDVRPELYAAALAASLAMAAGLARLRQRQALSPFALHVRAIERSLKLPVLRCLGVTASDACGLPGPEIGVLAGERRVRETVLS